jgi:outer membrane protein assembly factor BamB
MKRLLAFLLLPGALVGSLPGRAAAEPQDERDEPQFFSLPEDRDARALADLALDHLHARRWNEALGALERLILVHSGSILPPAYRTSRDLPSVHPAQPGAAAWARGVLGELDDETLGPWRERHEPADTRALADARASGDRRALSRLSRLGRLSARSAQALLVEGDLELERGAVAEATAAWLQARELDPEPELEAALDARLSVVDALPRPADPPRSSLTRDPGGSGGGWTAGALPRRDTKPWFTPLDLAPFGLARTDFYPALFPVLVGDRLLVSSSLRVFCLDAFTGEIGWQVGPPAGWDELSDKQRNDLFSHVNRPQILVAPAVGGRVVVAPLQLPFSTEPEETWQQIEIQRMIPQRRLYAFDLETGRALWDHAPELAWNAKEQRFVARTARDYAEEMRVAAPPVVAGSRVLVPCYRLQGRIDFHVACYALETGELLWATAVVSGQRIVNMFGRPQEEYVGAPVVLDDSRVIVQTDLGTIAVLDLFTGEILWESRYRQIPLPDPKGWGTQQRPIVWRVSPPIVVGDVVVATPSDSSEIAAFAVDDGRVLWTQSESALQNLDSKRLYGYDLLVGADETSVLLAGAKLGVLRKAGGIASTAPFDVAWPPQVLEEDEDVRVGSQRLPWPLVGGESILLSHRSRRRVVDRSSGTERRFLEAENEWSWFGNVIVTRGALFSVGSQGVAGFLDWNQLLEGPRARLAFDPDDDDAILELARLYVRRSEVESSTGDEGAALAGLRAAREALRPVREHLLAVEPPDERMLARLDAELFHVLEREAALLELDGNRGAALESLQAARALAPTPEDLRDCLLHAERILAGWRRLPEALAVLDELERTSADLPFPLPSPRWQEIGLPEPDPEAPPSTIPIGPWVLFARAAILASEGELAGALEDWHAVLERHPDLRIGSTSAAAVARERIAALLEHPGAREAYAPLEARAAELYARALEEDDAEELAAVCRLFPHSRAAADADRARLQQAHARGDAVGMAAILYSEEACLARPADFERDSLLELADLLAKAGNTAFELGLFDELARETPDERSRLPAHEERTFAELAAERRERNVSPPPLVPRFDARVVSVEERKGLYTFLGSFVRASDPEETPEEVHVYAVNKDGEDTLEAFSSLGDARQLWSCSFPPPGIERRAWAVAGERIVLADRIGGIHALDGAGGLAWSTSLDTPVHWLVAQSGIVLVGAGTGAGASDPARVLAFDVWNGIPLWSLAIDAGARRVPPILGGGCAAFLSLTHARPPRAVVVDLFRGRELAAFDLDAGGERIDPVAWISGDRLLVPRFVPPQGVKAYDLRSGREVWQRPVPEGELLHSVVEIGGRDYWITEADSPGANGAIYALDPGRGQLPHLATLAPGEEPIGIQGHMRTVLPGNALYTLTHGTTNEVPIRVFELPGRVRRYALKLPPQALDLDGVLPFPASSAECIALVVFTRDTGGRRTAPLLVFLERREGDDANLYPIDTGDLAPELGDARRIELRGLGESLFAIGSGSSERGQRMQILERFK